MRRKDCRIANELARAWPPDRLFDLHHAALVRVEPDLVGIAPAADDLVVDLEDPGPRRVLARVLLRDLLVDRTEPVLREEILRGVIQNELNLIITTGYVLGGLIGVCTFGLQKLLGL